MHYKEQGDSKSFIEILNASQTSLGKGDGQIAAELGLASPGVYTLIRQSKMTLPAEYLPQLAAALEIDADELLHAYLSEYLPELLQVIDKVTNPLRLTPTERRLVEHCRQLSQGRDAAPVVFDGKSVIALVTT